MSPTFKESQSDIEYGRSSEDPQAKNETTKLGKSLKIQQANLVNGIKRKPFWHSSAFDFLSISCSSCAWPRENAKQC